MPRAITEIRNKKKNCWAWWAFPNTIKGGSEPDKLNITTKLNKKTCNILFFLKNAPSYFFTFHTNFRNRLNNIKSISDLDRNLLPSIDHRRFYFFIKLFIWFFNEMSDVDTPTEIQKFKNIIISYKNLDSLFTELHAIYDPSDSYLFK